MAWLTWVMLKVRKIIHPVTCAHAPKGRVICHCRARYWRPRAGCLAWHCSTASTTAGMRRTLIKVTVRHRPAELRQARSSATIRRPRSTAALAKAALPASPADAGGSTMVRQFKVVARRRALSCSVSRCAVRPEIGRRVSSTPTLPVPIHKRSVGDHLVFSDQRPLADQQFLRFGRSGSWPHYRPRFVTDGQRCSMTCGYRVQFSRRSGGQPGPYLEYAVFCSYCLCPRE